MALQWDKAARRQDRRFITEDQRREMKDSLRRLGFDSYRQYLASDLWDGIRKRVIDRDGGQCRRCRKPATTVHHQHYGFDVMRGAIIDSLAASCSGCHKCAGHWGQAARTIKPLSDQRKKQLKNQAIKKRKCPGCGNLKRHGLCRRCKRAKAAATELDREFRAIIG